MLFVSKYLNDAIVYPDIANIAAESSLKVVYLPRYHLK